MCVNICLYFRFTGMGIIHTARKYIKDELVRKMRIERLEERRRININANISIRDDAEVGFTSHRYFVRRYKSYKFACVFIMTLKSC